MKAFNIKVNEARKISKEIKEERRDTEDSIAFDLSEPGKPVLFQYANPSKGYCTGKVLKTGKYFVATVPILPLGIENTVDKVFVRIIYSSRLIAGKEEFNNREETLQAKFPVGAEKYFAFDDKGKITVKDHKVKVVQAPVQAPVVQDAVEELAKEMTSKAMPKSKVEAKPKTTARI
jgi:hypothetical protein